MSPARKMRCDRCGKRLRKGGDNYRFECVLVADFDGYLDTRAMQRPEELLAEIDESDLTEAELAEQVHFSLKQLLCFECRTRVLEFLKGETQDG